MNREVTVTLNPAQFQKAKTLAAAKDITIQALIRELLYNAPLHVEPR